MKQQRYLDKSGKRDWIDKCAEELSELEFNGAMFFTIGKYYQRLGKKDPEEQELAKVEDYKQRWINVLAGDHGEEYRYAVEYVESQCKRAKALAREE